MDTIPHTLSSVVQLYRNTSENTTIVTFTRQQYNSNKRIALSRNAEKSGFKEVMKSNDKKEEDAPCNVLQLQFQVQEW
eukprot:scaffold33511_cov130-Skeletonema_dohrnii-CCMP3373.AAC.8